MISEDSEGKKMARYICSDCYKSLKANRSRNTAPDVVQMPASCSC